MSKTQFPQFVFKASPVGITVPESRVILTGMPSLNVCHAYEQEGERFEDLPAGLGALDEVQPMLEELGTWDDDITGAIALDDLPPAALAYIQRIDHATDLPIRMISVGPEREQLIIR